MFQATFNTGNTIVVAELTADGLKDLAAWESLTYLGLRYTEVTDAGVKELQ